MIHHHIARASVVLILLLALGGCHHQDAISQQVPEVSAASYSTDDWAAVLTKVVTPDGYVQWSMLQGNKDGVRGRLTHFMGVLAAVSPANHPELFRTDADRRAYWINAYNAMCMFWVVQYDYPAMIPATMPEQFTIGRQLLSPNDIVVWFKAHDPEPSVYFALNWGAHSCPPLRNVPYDGPILQAQLQDQGHVYLNDPRAVSRQGDVVEINHYLYAHILDFAHAIGRDDAKYWQAYWTYAADDSPIIGATDAVDAGFDWSLNRPPR